LEPPENDPERDLLEAISLRLTAPAKSDPPTDPWLVVAHNKKVLNGWQQLVHNTSQNAINCYDWLLRHPMKPIPGRCYALKHKAHAGNWCYEVGAGDRVYYKPDEVNKKVTVWYAGPHPHGKIPMPPKGL
jgi:hypothetical protein